MMAADVVVSTVGEDHVGTVSINRPPNNYFDVSLIASIADGYEALERESGCRAIVLRSEGKHFCAGAALGSHMQSGGQQESGGQEHPGGGPSPGSLYAEALRLFAARLPVVATIQGGAIGGGLGLALSADFRVAAAESRWSANFARLGFHHGFGLSVTLPALVGQQQAMRMLLTGVRLGGEEAQRIGLADQLVDVGELEAAARALAGEVAASAPLAVDSIRQTMRAGLVDKIREATERERAEQDRLARTNDFAEGVRAMAERRPPRFEGK